MEATTEKLIRININYKCGNSIIGHNSTSTIHLNAKLASNSYHYYNDTNYTLLIYSMNILLLLSKIDAEKISSIILGFYWPPHKHP
jgi:hypothetical protein